MQRDCNHRTRATRINDRRNEPGSGIHRLVFRSTPAMKGLEMDKDRIKGVAQQAKGAIKEAIGKATGDAKLETEGKTDKVAGKMQNAIGGFKDTLRGK